MMWLVVILLGVAVLAPAHAQEFYDTAPTLSVEVLQDSRYLYRDGEYVVLLGEVLNDDSRAFLSDVAVQVRFFAGSEVVPVTARTIQEVVPPGVRAPFEARLHDPDGTVVDAEPGQVSFAPAGEKQDLLRVHTGSIIHGAELVAGGVVSSSPAPEHNVTAHVVVYDAFEPPRVIAVKSFDIGYMGPGERAEFEFRGAVGERASSLVMFAESASSYSAGRAEADVPPQEGPQASAQISDVTLSYLYETPGVAISGSEVSIGGKLDVIRGNGTAYEYYVQVKRSGDIPYVEFLGVERGILGGPDPVVGWTPAEEGLYFVETFLWDSGGAPIADRGPLLLIAVQ